MARKIQSAACARTNIAPRVLSADFCNTIGHSGFTEIENHTEIHTFVLPSFDAYYGPFERGGASTDQALSGLSDEIRRAVREEVRRDLGDTGGPIEVEAEYRIVSGRRE